MKWNFSQGVRTGCIHEKQGLPCQDMVKAAYSRQDMEDAVYVAALADGAGSASHSTEGARKTVEFICGWIKKHFNETYSALEAGEKDKTAEKIKKSLHRALKKTARRNGVSGIDSLACTMMFAAASNGRYITGHIGDGIIATLAGNNNSGQSSSGNTAGEQADTMLFSAPQNGKYINETFFVTDPLMDRLIELKHGSISAENIKAFALMSDGISDAVWKRTDGTFVNSFTSLLKYATENPLMAGKEIANLLEKATDVATDDDCSLIIMSAQQ